MTPIQTNNSMSFQPGPGKSSLLPEARLPSPEVGPGASIGVDRSAHGLSSSLISVSSHHVCEKVERGTASAYSTPEYFVTYCIPSYNVDVAVRVSKVVSNKVRVVVSVVVSVTVSVCVRVTVDCVVNVVVTGRNTEAVLVTITTVAELSDGTPA